ncbi:YwmB family TATA-box binding protein [Pseudoneobacillus sp. C159]
MDKKLVGVILVISIFLLVGLSFFQFGNKTIVANGAQQIQWHELLTIGSILEKENVDIQEWATHSREHLTNFTNKKEVVQLQTRLQKEFPNWDWTIHDDQKSGNWKAIATNKNSTKNFQETIQIMATLTNEQFHSYLLYEVKGTKWNDQTRDFFQNKWNSRKSNIFRGKATNFSCMKADINDKMGTSLTNSADNWLGAFQAKEIEALQEPTFVSISASSPLFAESIQTKNEAMNLQLAIRSNGLGGNTSLVIGTPIITIEY